MCTQRLQSLRSARPLYVRLRRLLIREVRLIVILSVAVGIALWLVAYEVCVFHALTGL